MILNASSPSASNALVKVHASVKPYNFTKECFKDMKVKMVVVNCPG